MPLLSSSSEEAPNITCRTGVPLHESKENTVKESKIEQAVKKYARENGWLVFKFTSPGRRGVPDKIFLKEKNAVFPEFKSPGKKPGPLQEKTLEKIRKQGFNAPVIDKIEAGKKIFT